MTSSSLARCALGAAALTLCAWLGVPLGNTVFTLQLLGVFLILGLLGGKTGFVAIFAYLLLGAVGAPVFSGFRGGIWALLGPTGGYLVGFLAIAGVYALVTKFWGDTGKTRLLAFSLGLALCYLFGSLWYSLGYLKGLGFWAVAIQCVLPYLPLDLAKLILSHVLICRLRRILPKQS